MAELALTDGSSIHVRDYLFPSGGRKCAYHWQHSDGTLIARWDNAAHWPDVGTYPCHVHDGAEDSVKETAVNDLYAVLEYIRERVSGV